MNIYEHIVKIKLREVLLMNKDKIKKIYDKYLYSKYYIKNFEEYANHYFKRDLEYFNFIISRTKDNDKKLYAIIKFILYKGHLGEDIRSNLHLILHIIKKMLDNKILITKEKTKKIINELSNDNDLYDILKNNFTFDELVVIKEL